MVTMGVLYIVSTPIGNLDDVTFRAVEVLKRVGLIAAEDTRTTRKLLQRYEIHVPVLSYYEANRKQRIPVLLERLQESDVALVSDAGTPGVRDPGQDLIQAAADAGVSVVPIPGPSAVTAAIAISGLSADEFTFLGFLPSRAVDRRRALENIARETRTLVVFEAPHRIRASLEDMAAILGADRAVVACRELTKLFEEVYRGTISEAKAHFAQPRGEFTLVIEGASVEGASEAHDNQELLDDLRQLKASRIPVREAMAWMARHYGLARRDVYRMWLELDRE